MSELVIVGIGTFASVLVLGWLYELVIASRAERRHLARLRGDRDINARFDRLIRHLRRGE